MVRQVDIRCSVAPCSAATFWAAVYAGAEPTAAYHAAVNKDPTAQVTPWQEGVRSVTFTMPLQAPDFVKRIANIDSVSVRETQAVVWSGAGEAGRQSCCCSCVTRCSASIT